ncbi:MAG: AmmeMemoRadiSam system radical SAM enzyme [Desulfobulbaceae bacterium]|nr:AmmeMemoRadiSam system radical SAM enzyme [Desulfobulbaceae bacterium]
MKEAMFYSRVEDGKIHCELCRFRCLIGNGERGHCKVRENRGGVLYSLVYGTLCAEHVDPIEKKPLFHVMPGSTSYSIATVGCNFRCHHCQNASISQPPPNSFNQRAEVSPREIVNRSKESLCRSISYTYTEPTVFFEFAYDTARLARAAGLHNIFVSNGYISKAALTAIAPYLNAANIDLKGFSQVFYRDIAHAKLSEVLDSILEYRKLGVWLEITTLFIPGHNDTDQDMQGIATFIMNNLGPDTPWHVSQFHPTYRLTDRPPTPLSTLRRAREIGFATGLNYVYEGNAPGEDGENTFCPSCRALLIKRRGFTIVSNTIKKGMCPDCGTTIPGIGM